MSKINIMSNNLSRVAAANLISMKQHLADTKKQNEIFIKEYEKKVKELEDMNPELHSKEFNELSQEVTKMAAAIKLNEDTIKKLELS